MTDHLDLEIRSIPTAEDGSFEGYAVIFGTIDRYRTVFARSAFNLDGRSIPILWNHQTAEPIGSITSAVADSVGLKVTGKLNLDVQRAREVRSMLLAGDLKGLSVGFNDPIYSPGPAGSRQVIKADLVEVSVTALPAVPGSGVTSVRNAAASAKKEGTMPDTNEAAQTVAEETRSTPDFSAATAEIQNQLRVITDRLAAVETRANRPTAGNQPTEPATETRAFLNFVRHGVERMGADEVRALTVANDASAGYLAPDAYGSEIVKALVQFSPIRQYARVVSVSAPALKYPKRLTGPAATWTDESADSTESTPTYGEVTLTPYELRTYIDVSQALLEDNQYNLEGELVTDLAEAFGVTEATAFVTGDGTGKPKGIVAATGITEVKTGAAATLGTSPADTLIGLYHSLPAPHAQNAVWLMNRTTLSTLRQLKDSTGRYLLVDPVSAAAPMTLLGRPVVEAVDMPNVAANAYPIIFGDLQGYRIVDRVSFTMLRDPYSQATKGRVRLHARRRVGGDVTHTDRFVKLKVSA